MENLLAVVEGSLLTTNWKGDVFIIAFGVFVGNFAWGVVLGATRWWLAAARNRELEETIAAAIAKREADGERAPTP